MEGVGQSNVIVSAVGFFPCRAQVDGWTQVLSKTRIEPEIGIDFGEAAGLVRKRQGSSKNAESDQTASTL
jgi:hypothetical protein